MSVKYRPLHQKGDENAIMVLISEDEIDGIIDAIDMALSAVDLVEDDETFYRGLRNRWERHAKDIRRSIRHNLSHPASNI